MKPILDVCCGSKMFYFDKEDERVDFCDIRDIETFLCDGRKFEVHPDYQCDFTNLPFQDESYSMVVFDPPHLLGESNGWQKIKYGWLDKNNWKDTITKGFSECFRVLKSGGFLIFKWNETNIPVSEVLKCTEEKPIFGHRVGKLNKTHWICFMKEMVKNVNVQIEKYKNKSLTDLGVVFSDEKFFCDNCKNEVDINYEYCPKCGSKLIWK